MIKKDKLKDGCIVEVRCGRRFIHIGDFFYSVEPNKDCFYKLDDFHYNLDEYDNYLLFKDRNRKHLDIVKIGFVNWVMTRKDILNDEEREYLKTVIKPVKDKVHFIEKISFTPLILYVYIRVDNDYMTFYRFETNKQFINMELGKKYTLKELGLE